MKLNLYSHKNFILKGFHLTLKFCSYFDNLQHAVKKCRMIQNRRYGN